MAFIKWSQVFLVALSAAFCLALAFPAFVSGGKPFPDLTLDADFPFGVLMTTLAVALAVWAVRWALDKS
jgi:hypothetical protein